MTTISVFCCPRSCLNLVPSFGFFILLRNFHLRYSFRFLVFVLLAYDILLLLFDLPFVRRLSLFISLLAFNFDEGKKFESKVKFFPLWLTFDWNYFIWANCACFLQRRKTGTSIVWGYLDCSSYERTNFRLMRTHVRWKLLANHFERSHGISSFDENFC